MSDYVPITAIIPCKDERHNLAACVESLRRVVSEVIVADSGSTDGTLELARQLDGCRVIEREFVNYADFKNWAIPQARHGWVLILDADERMTDELADEIQHRLATATEEIDGYWIGRRNFYLGHEIRHGGWERDRVLRLFRRDRCRYRPSRVHEQIDVAAHRTQHLQNKMLHFTYRSLWDYLVKLERYARLRAMDMYDQGCRARRWRLVTAAPCALLRDFIFRRGFLDGVAGLHVCMLGAFYAFLKQAWLWELEHRRPMPEPAAVQHESSTVLLSASGKWDRSLEVISAGRALSAPRTFWTFDHDSRLEYEADVVG